MTEETTDCPDLKGSTSVTLCPSCGHENRDGARFWFQHLERREGAPFGPSLVIRGARERLAPILMTALATGLALVPLAIGGDIPGHEIEHAMAIVILGGLVTSTLLNLFVVPALFLRVARPLGPALSDR
jgi:AcrB/AcrD/AcrF family